MFELTIVFKCYNYLGFDCIRCFILEEQHLENIASYIGAIAQMLKYEQKKTDLDKDKESGGGGGAKRKAKPRSQDGGGKAEVIVESKGKSRARRERKSSQHDDSLFVSFLYM